MAEDREGKVDLAEFLDEHSSLFVVLGVFSALAIYVSDLGGEPLNSAPLQIRIGFAGSLLLSLLLLLVIYREMINHVGSVENLFRAHTDFKNWDLMIFTAGAAFLLPSLVTPLLRQVSTLYYVLGFLGLVFSLPPIFKIIIGVEGHLAEEGLTRQGQKIGLLVATNWLATRYTEYIASNPRLTGTEPFSLSNINPVFYDVTATIAYISRTVALLFIGVIGLQFADELGDWFRDQFKL